MNIQMKKIIYSLITAVLLLSCGNAETKKTKLSKEKSKTEYKGINFCHDLDEALAKAKLENKLVFVDFYTSWCGPCKKLTKFVFPQEKVGDYFNSKFINCKIQCDDKGVGAKLQKVYNIVAYPTLMFLNKNGEIVHSQSGGPSAEGLIKLAQKANDPKFNLISITKKYESGDRSVEVVNEYFTKMSGARRVKQANKDFVDYFHSLSTNEKQTTFVFNLVEMLNFKPFTEIFEYIEKNIKVYNSIASEDRVSKFIKLSYLKYMYAKRSPELRLKVKNRGYSFYEEQVEFIGVGDVISMKNIKRVPEYVKRADAFLKKYGHLKENYANSITQRFCSICWGQKLAVAGVRWMEDLLKRDRSVKYLKTYARILKWNLRFDDSKIVLLEVRDELLKNDLSTNRVDKDIDDIAALKEKYKKKILNLYNNHLVD